MDIPAVMMAAQQSTQQVFAAMEASYKKRNIAYFVQFLHDYGHKMSLLDYGKLRAAMNHNYSLRWAGKYTAQCAELGVPCDLSWLTHSPSELTLEEVEEIFGGENPDEMSDNDFQSAVLTFFGLSLSDWLNIGLEDTRCKITPTYLPTRSAIQAWCEEHGMEETAEDTVPTESNEEQSSST